MRLIVRSSPIHAAGVFTLEAVAKGKRILEYTGERIVHEEADKLYADRPYTYLFGVGDGVHVIDGYGMSMYVNHSCHPNCETVEDAEQRVWIVAMRDIEPGEELTYDYLLYDGADEAPCTCGTANCRGSLYSKEELRKKRQAAASSRQGGRKRRSA
jgi:SET domain-containing protein